MAVQVAGKNNLGHPFKDDIAGKKWVSIFLKRHRAKLSERKPTGTSFRRALGFSKENIEKFYKLLENVYDKGKFTPDRIYNVDESGITVVQSKVPKVIGLKGKRQIAALTSGERGALITVVAFLILNKLTSVLPNREVTHNNWPHIQGLQLADPFYYKRLPIDCILGADVYAAVLRNGVKRGPRATPVAQETVLGWILTGQTAAGRPEVSSCHHIAAFQTTVQPDTSEMLSRLWELEELPSQPRRSPEDDRCEQLYKETVYRNKEGRYVVKLPLFDTPHFPGSRDTALSTFLRAENRRQRKPTLNIAYIHFMEEYENLGHMVTVPHADAHKQSSYYMPHHEVVRTDGTKKIRVVFNASRSCTTGFSLNDFLKSGPKLQLDLPMLLTRWRMYKYVFSADIVKMFRQILVREDDADYQRIVWRSDPTKPIQDYKLTTVTYGTASAPYLAIRTLLQLAEDEEERYPMGSAILRTQTYVDDIFSGGNTIEDAILKRDQLIEILKSAGFPLGKWSSNHPTLLTGIHTALSNEKCIVYSDTVPTLGLKWSPEFDYFSFNVNWLTSSSIITSKRTILSQVAKLFDPLGWLSPVVIAAKILLQDLWLSGIDWDSPVVVVFIL
ncbi:uncharacterized protein LOC124158184 [Ischnura elegans]|uniref:uncharacterized protein LOC124158184 n=1 Tax=Ischnura elegans TaxID=197161 RepID=UPI001ED895B9|nr:uncharacterized protein LOC124158184 [Ischnura elegans]